MKIIDTLVMKSKLYQQSLRFAACASLIVITVILYTC